MCRVTLTCTANIEEYTVHALAKMAHSSASQLGKCLHETAWTKDCLDCQKQRSIESTKLDSELSMISPTNPPSATTSSIIIPPPCDNEGGPTERGLLQPNTPTVTFSWIMSTTQLPTTYTNKVGHWRVGLSLEGEGVSSVEYLHMAFKAM